MHGSKAIGFDEAVSGAVIALREALSRLLVAVDADPGNALRMARHLGLNKNLAWRIARIVRSEDPVEAVGNIPRGPGIEKFLESAVRAGASAEAIDAVRAAAAQLERVVETHAGDHETFETMLAHLHRDSGAQRDQEEGLRRAAFRGNSAIWGVRARVHLATHVLAPSGAPGMLDVATICGFVDFRRLRADVPWAVATLRQISEDGVTVSVGASAALDPKHAQSGHAPLLGAFCSAPLPPMQRSPLPDGAVRYELAGGPAGKTAACTCLMGWCDWRQAPRWRTGDDRHAEVFVAFSTPAELGVHDLLVHRDLTEARAIEGRLYSQLPGGPVFPRDGRERPRLSLYEEVQPLGTAPPDVVLPEYPRYAELLRTALGYAGWRVEDFYGFRLKLRYPPVPTIHSFQYELREG